MTKLKAVMFDMDGVLIDSERLSDNLLKVLLDIAPAQAEARFKLTPERIAQTECLLEAACLGRAGRDRLRDRAGKPAGAGRGRLQTAVRKEARIAL